jgi:uncharacterized iron-regulated membrane protein
MTIATSIILMILGAILRFAVTGDIGGIDLQIVGVILMIGGALGLVLGLVLMQRRRVVATRRVVTDVVDDGVDDVGV